MRLARLVSVLFALIVGGVTVGQAASAAGGFQTLCTGFTTCQADGYGTYGYPAAYLNSYWGQDGGHNCTNYVAFRFAAANVPKPSWLGHGNASSWGVWAPTAIVNHTPSPGAIAWWSGSSAFAAGDGHVAIVERVNPDGSFIDSEDNFGGDFNWRQFVPSQSFYPTAFIHYDDAALAGSSTAWPPANGTFVNVVENGQIYEIVGGAPLYVSSWNAFGGAQPTTTVSLAQLNSLPRTPADGTFVHGGQTGQVYEFAGGAPLYVSNWAAVGGNQPNIPVDQAALDNGSATAPVPWNHVNHTPADGTFVHGGQTGQVYEFAGGAPLYVSNWAAVGGNQPNIPVDQAALDNGSATAPVPWNHVNHTPADGTFLSTLAGPVYRVAGGAPIFVSNWNLFGGSQPNVLVDSWDITNTSSSIDHLGSAPVDGTVVLGLPSRQIWTFEGAHRVSGGGAASAITVDDVGLQSFPLATTGTPGQGGTSGSGGSGLTGSGGSQGGGAAAAGGSATAGSTTGTTAGTVACPKVGHSESLSVAKLALKKMHLKIGNILAPKGYPHAHKGYRYVVTGFLVETTSRVRSHGKWHTVFHYKRLKAGQKIPDSATVAVQLALQKI